MNCAPCIQDEDHAQIWLWIGKLRSAKKLAGGKVYDS